LIEKCKEKVPICIICTANQYTVCTDDNNLREKNKSTLYHFATSCRQKRFISKGKADASGGIKFMQNCNHVVRKSTIHMNNTYQSAIKGPCSDQTIIEFFLLTEPCIAAAMESSS
jgi:hypothetical protein